MAELYLFYYYYCYYYYYYYNYYTYTYTRMYMCNCSCCGIVSQWRVLCIPTTIRVSSTVYHCFVEFTSAGLAVRLSRCCSVSLLARLHIV